MTDKRQEEAQKIAEEIVKNVVRSRKSFPSQRIASDLEDLIEQALINYASKERGNLIKFIKDLDDPYFRHLYKEKSMYLSK